MSFSSIDNLISILEARLTFLQGKKVAFDQAWSRYRSHLQAQIAQIGQRPTFPATLTSPIKMASWSKFDGLAAGYMSQPAEDLRNALARADEALRWTQQATGTQMSSDQIQDLDELVPALALGYDQARSALKQWRDSSSFYADPKSDLLSRVLMTIGTTYGRPQSFADFSQSLIGRQYTPVRAGTVSEEAIMEAATGQKAPPPSEQAPSVADALKKQIMYLGIGAAGAVALYIFFKEYSK